MAGSKLDTFTVFPKLPKEIRLIIWERALPGPRVVNLRQRKLKKTIGEWETEAGHTWPPPKEGILAEDTEEEDDHVIVDLRESSQWRSRERSLLAGVLDANEYDEDAYKAGNLVGLISDCPPPEILSVCREAFEVVSKSYHEVFSSLGSIPTTYFCFELDTLYLRYNDFSAFCHQSNLISLTEELADSGFMLRDMDSLRRVKNMALLVPEDQEDLEWNEVIAGFSAIIGGLEKLYLVLEDHQGHDANSLSIIEPIAFDATIAAYKSFAAEPPKNSSEVPWPVLIFNWRIAVDLEEIQAMLKSDVEKGVCPWKIPEIDQKVVATRDLLEEMERMRSNYQMRVDEMIEGYGL